MQPTNATTSGTKAVSDERPLYAKEGFQHCSDDNKKYTGAKPRRRNFASVLVAGIPFLKHLHCSNQPHDSANGIHQIRSNGEITPDFSIGLVYTGLPRLANTCYCYK